MSFLPPPSPSEVPPPLPLYAKTRMRIISCKGNNFRILFTIARMYCGEVVSLEFINSKLKVFYRFKFALDVKNKCSSLVSQITFKKNDKAKDSTIYVKVCKGDFVKQSLCADDWIEDINLEPAIQLYKANTNCPVVVLHQFLAFVELDITMYEKRPKLLPLYKKLCEDTTFTDFSLKACDGSVPVHRAVLGMHSDVFLAMLNGEWKETAEGIISLSSITRQTVQHLKDYMYLGTLPQDLPELQLLLMLVACYMVDHLKADCIAKLVQLVAPENFDTLVEFACQNNVLDLMKAIVTGVPETVIHKIQRKKGVIPVSQKNEDNKNY